MSDQNRLERLEDSLFQEWNMESFGFKDDQFTDEESTFTIYQDERKFHGYKTNSSRLVLVSNNKVKIGKPDQDFEFIGCAWYGPNMRIAKFPSPITSYELAKETAEKMLL